MKIVCTSGFYNPVHKGHIALFEAAKNLYPDHKLVVIVNNDHQVKLKGSKEFMDEDERLLIIRSLGCVDYAVLSMDDDRTVCKTLEALRPNIFAKGGDSTPDNVPEKEVCRKYNIHIEFGVGGDKIQSSSNLKNKL